MVVLVERVLVERVFRSPFFLDLYSVGYLYLDCLAEKGKPESKRHKPEATSFDVMASRREYLPARSSPRNLHVSEQDFRIYCSSPSQHAHRLLVVVDDPLDHSQSRPKMPPRSSSPSSRSAAPPSNRAATTRNQTPPHSRRSASPRKAKGTSSPSSTRKASSNSARAPAPSAYAWHKLAPAQADTALTPSQQRVVARAEEIKLPPRLLLGLTIGGLRKVIANMLPADALEKANAAEAGPKSTVLDGYTLRHFARLASPGQSDGSSVCERHQQTEGGASEVGVATIFLCSHLGSPLSTLVAALENLISCTPCTEDTCFWLRDLCVRSSNGASAAAAAPGERAAPAVSAVSAAAPTSSALSGLLPPDLDSLEEVIGAIGHTVLLLETPHLYAQSKPLRCAYLVSELAYSARQRVGFWVTMSDMEEDRLHMRLLQQLDLFDGTLAGPPGAIVDARRLACRKEAKHEEPKDLFVSPPASSGAAANDAAANGGSANGAAANGGSPPSGALTPLSNARWAPNEATALKAKLGETVGFLRANSLVTMILTLALVAEGRSALRRLPEQVRAVSKIIADLANLLQRIGDMEEATTLLRSAVDGSKEAYGPEAPHTLDRQLRLGLCLKSQGMLTEAADHLHDCLAASRKALGELHPDTLICMEALESLAAAFFKEGNAAAAVKAFRVALGFHRTHLGEQNPRTLASVFNLGMLLLSSGQGEEAFQGEAQTLLDEAQSGARAALGTEHPLTKQFVDAVNAKLEGKETGHADEGSTAALPTSAPAADAMAAEAVPSVGVDVEGSSAATPAPASTPAPTADEARLVS